MAYYLSMDGIDDALSSPSLTFTEVVIDASVLKDGAIRRYWGLPFGAEFLQWSGSVDEFTAGVTVYLNNVSKPSGTNFIPNDTRATVKIVASSAKTGTSYFFNNNGGTCFGGKIYSVKLYNGATLVAHYDMTLGNVQDQSGNGNHATLTGGTWVSDVAGVTHTGAASLQGVSTITASATRISAAITGSAFLQGVATLSAAATVTNNSVTGAATFQGIGTLTATGGLIRSSGANMQGVSTLSAFAAGLTVLGGASLTGVGWVMASGVSGANIARSVNLLASMVEAINLFAETVAPINLQGSWISPVTLQGSKPEPIALEGGLMTKLKQNFSMYAGDTPPLTFTMSDSTNLSGATVKWSMRKGHVKGSQVLLKTSSNGGLSVSGSVVTVSLLNTDTFSLEGQFYHEAEVTDVSGKVSTVLTGIVTIEPSGV